MQWECNLIVSAGTFEVQRDAFTCNVWTVPMARTRCRITYGVQVNRFLDPFSMHACLPTVSACDQVVKCTILMTTWLYIRRRIIDGVAGRIAVQLLSPS
jgi:hypothetical protein